MCVMSVTSVEVLLPKASEVDKNLTVALLQIFFKTSVFVR